LFAEPAGKKSAENLYTGLTRNLTSRESRAVLISSTAGTIMEFPPESYDVFDSEQFETAPAVWKVWEKYQSQSPMNRSAYSS
jgi:hypothetical protein